MYLCIARLKHIITVRILLKSKHKTHECTESENMAHIMNQCETVQFFSPGHQRFPGEKGKTKYIMIFFKRSLKNR